VPTTIQALATAVIALSGAPLVVGFRARTSPTTSCASVWTIASAGP